MSLLDRSGILQKTRILTVLSIMSVFVCASGLSQQARAQAINTSSIYRNDAIGVRAAFAPQWNVITSRAQAPDVIKPNFPENKGPNDSPLFIGIHDNQQLFMRLLIETFFDDLEAYTRILAQGIQGQGLEITAARMSIDNSALEIEYQHPELGLRFRERVSILPDSQLIRMATWTASSVWNSSTQLIEDAFAGVELNNAINAANGWQPVWQDLEQRLNVFNIDGVVQDQRNIRSDSAQVCADPSASMLWQVESPALTEKGSEIFLFGSIHVGKESFYPLAKEIEDAFDSADFLVFEVDPNAAADPSVLMSMQTRGMLPQGQTLVDVISPGVIAEFRRVMGNMGMPAENFMGMQPWFLTLMLTSLQMNALGYLPQYGLESYFLSQKPAGVEILELESIQQQIGFLEALNAETYLAYTIQAFESGNEEIEDIIQAWECADKAPLTQLLFSDFKNAEMSEVEQADMDALMASIYTRRNIDMAAKIANYTNSEQGSYFIVVGSAHLLGEGSVVEHLRGQNFVVTPVSIAR